MRAVVQDRYGSPDRLRVREVQRPAVGDDEVLVRVRAASVHPDVWHVVSGRPVVLRLMGSGLLRPRCRIPGTDLAGPFAAYRRVLTPDGRYVLIGHDHYGRAGRRCLGSLPRFGRLAVLSLFVRQLRGAGSGRPSKKEAMATLRAHLEAGRLTPVIDRTYPLCEAGEAIRYLADGEPVGRVVLTV